jgi:hypothetical protein
MSRHIFHSAIAGSPLFLVITARDVEQEHQQPMGIRHPSVIEPGAGAIEIFQY